MKTGEQNTFRLGDLIVALYDETAKETKNDKLQSAIVALALLDLRSRMKRRHVPQKPRKAA